MLTQQTHKPVDRRQQRRRHIRRAVAQKHAKRSAHVCATPAPYSGPPIDLPVMEWLIQSGYDDQILYDSNPYMDSVPAWYSREVAQHCWPEQPFRRVEVQPYTVPARSLPWGAFASAAMGGWAFLHLLSSFSFSTFFMCLFGLLFAEQKLPVPQRYRRVFQGGTVFAIVIMMIGTALT